MSNSEIIEYVKQQLSADYSKEQITETLLSSGWKNDDINEVFVELEGGVYELSHVEDSNDLLVNNSSENVKEETVSEVAKQKVDLVLVSILGVVIALVTLFGVVQINFNASVLLNVINPFVIPAYVVAGILVFISLRLFKHLYKTTGNSILSFLVTLSIYFLSIIGLIYLFFLIVQFSSAALPGTVVWGYLFVAATAVQLSYVVFYLGLALLMILIINKIKKNPVSTAESSPLFMKVSSVTIFISGLLLVYFLGLVAPVAKVTGMQSLCSFVYHKHVKMECLSEDPVNIEGAVYKTEAGNFDIIVDGEAIGDIEVVNNKIAYTFAERKMGDILMNVVYDGEILGKYEYVYKLNNIDDNLVYLVQNENGSASRYTLIHSEGKSADFDKSINNLVDINGKLAFEVYDMQNPYVYFDEKKYGNDFVFIESLVAYSGQPAFKGKRDLQYYIQVGDKEYGPYESVYNLKEKDGHLFALIENNGETLAFVDGEVHWVGKGYKKKNSAVLGKVGPRRTVDLIEGKISTVVNKNGKNILVLGDREITEVSSYNSGPYDIDGKLGYVALNSNGSSQFVIDGQVVPKNVYNEPVYDVSVSKSANIAVKTIDSKGVIRIYVDGEVVYEGDDSLVSVENDLSFIGDKLLFSIKRKDGVSVLWYNNAVIEDDHLKFKQTIPLNDKLLILAEKDLGKGIILLEQ